MLSKIVQNSPGEWEGSEHVALKHGQKSLLKDRTKKKLTFAVNQRRDFLLQKELPKKIQESSPGKAKRYIPETIL